MTEIEDLENERLFCINARCKLVSHLQCLAKICLQEGHYIPTLGVCPLCETKILWGDLIRKRNKHRPEELEAFEEEEEYDI